MQIDLPHQLPIDLRVNMNRLGRWLLIGIFDDGHGGLFSVVSHCLEVER